MSDTKPASLVSKLAEVMAAVGRVPKRGYNDFHKYKFATESDIVDAVRDELSKRSVMLFPSVVGSTRVSVGDKGQVLTTIDMLMTFVDGETDQRMALPWSGAGTDKEDKGLYKALTGGEKYFLLKTFLIPTGDDPEADGAAVKPAAAKAAPRPVSAAPAAPAVAAARPPLPRGGCYIDRVVPKRKGSASWLEIALYNGMAVVPVIATDPKVIEHVDRVIKADRPLPIIASCSKNAKGAMVLDGLVVWADSNTAIDREIAQREAVN